MWTSIFSHYNVWKRLFKPEISTYVRIPNKIKLYVISLNLALIRHLMSLCINSAPGCTSGPLHSWTGKNTSARNNISFKWSQWKVLMTSGDLSRHLCKWALGNLQTTVTFRRPLSKSANWQCEHSRMCRIYRAENESTCWINYSSWAVLVRCIMQN